MEGQQRRSNVGLYMALILLVIWGVYWMSNLNGSDSSLSHNEYQTLLTEGEIVSAVITPNKETPTGEVYVTTSGGNTYLLYTDNVAEARQELLAADVTVRESEVQTESTFMTIVLPIILGMFVVAVLVMLMMNRMMAGASGGSNSKMMNFGKSRARMIKGLEGINFGSVAGLHEEKEDLEEIVDFLKAPEKYIRVGARIPKGVLLVGPPGTGKTLLAKAVAGEAGVPFFSISGSDFVEMFVGVGASRVRDLFEEAKKNAPCIIFIDEIDAVARRRGTGMGGGHDEREQTLNQLLVEMDGFGVNEGIIVMAAPNRVDILDPAILRPGRFDR